MPDWEESHLALEGLQLALRTHGPAQGAPVIALHGWRDNAASFELLGPLLPRLRLIAPDMPGHGLSSWRGSEGTYYIWSYLREVLGLADALKLKRFSLLGHSMGGAVACLFAALYPERVDKLLLLDAVGPLATEPRDAPGQMRRALAAPAGGRERRHYYADFNAAVRARAAKGLSFNAAAMLGRRGIARDESGYYWTLDPRLAQPNPLSLTEAQARAFLRLIEAPTLLVAAPAYWTVRRDWFEARCRCFGNLRIEELPGGHHQHMEGQAEAVAGLLGNFLASR